MQDIEARSENPSPETQGQTPSADFQIKNQVRQPKSNIPSPTVQAFLCDFCKGPFNSWYVERRCPLFLDPLCADFACANDSRTPEMRLVNSVRKTKLVQDGVGSFFAFHCKKVQLPMNQGS